MGKQIHQSPGSTISMRSPSSQTLFLLQVVNPGQPGEECFPQNVFQQCVNLVIPHPHPNGNDDMGSERISLRETKLLSQYVSYQLGSFKTGRRPLSRKDNSVGKQLLRSFHTTADVSFPPGSQYMRQRNQ